MHPGSNLILQTGLNSLNFHQGLHLHPEIIYNQIVLWSVHNFLLNMAFKWILKNQSTFGLGDLDGIIGTK